MIKLHQNIVWVRFFLLLLPLMANKVVCQIAVVTSFDALCVIMSHSIGIVTRESRVMAACRLVAVFVYTFINFSAACSYDDVMLRLLCYVVLCVTFIILYQFYIYYITLYLLYYIYYIYYIILYYIILYYIILYYIILLLYYYTVFQKSTQLF